MHRHDPPDHSGHRPHEGGGGGRNQGRADPHGDEHPSPSRGSSGRLGWVFGITAAFMVVELVGGVLSGSLALLADAAHMLTDLGAIGISLAAMRLARRPARGRRTFGYVRIEILAAFVNGAVLLLLSGLVAWEAIERARAPVAIDGALMLGVAALGLLVNLVGAGLLRARAHESLNVRGAYLHILGDLLGSIGAMVAGVVIVATGWTLADPIVSVAIAGLILVGAWRLVREAADILLEAAPAHVDLTQVMADLDAIDGLEEVHDLHVWTLTSGFIALAAHGIVDDPAQHTRILEEIRTRMNRHGIEHVTFQLEMRPLLALRREAPVDPSHPR